MTPRWPLTPLLLRSHVTLPKDHIYPSPMKICQSVWIRPGGYDDPFFFKNLNQRSLTSMIFDPKSVEVTYVTLPKDHYVQVPWKYIKVFEYSDPFSKNLNQRSLTPRWSLTPQLLRSHVWLYPRITVSKSHGNTSMYVNTVINFAKYHIHTMYTRYILRTEWVIT